MQTLLANDPHHQEHDMTDKTVDAFAVRKFRDAGTETEYQPGVIRLSEGEFVNFKAAGLVRKPTEDEVKDSKAAEKPADKSTTDTKTDGKTKA